MLLSCGALVLLACMQLSLALRSCGSLRAPSVRGCVRLFAAGAGFGDKKTHKLPLESSFPSVDAFAKGKSLVAGTMEGVNVDLAALAAKSKESAFEKLTYPTPFALKIIGANNESFLRVVLDTLAPHCAEGTPSAIPHTVTESKGKGTAKYISLTATPTFASAAQILAAYEALGKAEGVKFVL